MTSYLPGVATGYAATDTTEPIAITITITDNGIREEMADDMDAAIKWLRGLAEVVEVADVRTATKHFVDKKENAG
jgi:hypothetical protein